MLFPQVALPIYIPTNRVGGFPFLQILVYILDLCTPSPSSLSTHSLLLSIYSVPDTVLAVDALQGLWEDGKQGESKGLAGTSGRSQEHCSSQT